MISVIVPIYNVEKYLEKCVESVFAQLYEDYELILVDDGTGDSCAEMSDEFGLCDLRVITIHKPNGGLSDARNWGLAIMSGKYVTFLDSDDYILPQMLCKMQQRISQNRTDVCICGFNRVNEDGVITKTEVFFDRNLSGEESLELLTQGNVNFIISCAKLYKKSLFDGLKFKVGKIHEDEFIAHYVLGRSKRISSVSTPFYQYLFRDESITNCNKVTEKNFNSVEAFVDRVEFFLNDANQRLATRMLVRAIDEYEGLLPAYDKSEKTSYLSELRKKLHSLTFQVDKKQVSFPRRIGFVIFRFGDRAYKIWMKLYKGKKYEKDNKN